jgi:hypothetical protein
MVDALEAERESGRSPTAQVLLGHRRLQRDRGLLVFVEKVYQHGFQVENGRCPAV